MSKARTIFGRDRFAFSLKFCLDALLQWWAEAADRSEGIDNAVPSP
jgi:hypothetical protein